MEAPGTPSSSPAQIAATPRDLFQRRDQGFAAFEAEALGAGVSLVEKLLEHF